MELAGSESSDTEQVSNEIVLASSSSTSGPVLFSSNQRPANGYIVFSK